MSAIRTSGLTVELDGRRVLEAVDLELEAGSFTLVEGPSGSGKSTLLRAIAGLVLPAKGSIDLFGVRASDPGRARLAPAERGIGFLFQGGGLWPHLSVQRTLELVLGARGVSRGERAKRTAELVELVELRGLERRRPPELSGGEAQRLALARALAVEPRILLLDEPLGPLDARLRGDLLGRIGELHDRLGWTTLFVTHDPAEAARLADSVVHVEAGRVERRALSH